MKYLYFLAALPSLMLAQTIEGTWQGTLIPPNQNGEIRIAFTIAKEGSAYQGRFYNLSNGRQFNLGSVSLEGSTLAIVIPGNGMSYEGKLDADGNSVAGKLTQGTNPLPLSLKRSTSETAWDLPSAPAAPAPLPQGAKLEFEVATIKPSLNAPQPPGFSVTATELRSRSTNLRDVLAFAYRLHPNQIASLPDWGATEGYEITARLPQGGDPSDDQLRTMLQNLIKARFGLTSHTERRELSVYVIEVGRSGPAGIKMVKNTTNGARIGGQGLGRVAFSGMTMAGFADQLQLRVVDRPVIDKSGLTERYDFTLEWTPDEFQFPAATPAQRTAATSTGLPDLFTAVQQQLGMKLEASKAPVDVLVIDRVSKPSAN